MQRVYRVEASCGIGVYQFSGKLNKAGRDIRGRLNMEHSGSHRPSAWEDFNPDWLDRINLQAYRFGCPNLDALKEWFDGFLEDFVRNRSIKIVSYIPMECKVGYSRLQCMFVPIEESKQFLTKKDLGL